jgi:ABC-2 type transport system permease protein
VAVAWLLFVVLLPSSINAVASTLYPVPSRVEYIQSLREASEGEVAERSRLMAAFYEDHPEFVKGSVSRLDDFTLTKEKLNERMAARLRPVTERFGRQIKN